MNINELKEKQSIKLTYHFQTELNKQEPKVFRGIVLKVTDNDLYLLDIYSSAMRSSYRNHSSHVAQLPKECITEVSRARFPKPISDHLHKLANEIQEAEKITKQIQELEQAMNQKRKDISIIEDNLLETRLEVQPNPSDLAKKLNKDIQELSARSYQGEDKEVSFRNANVNSSNGQLYIIVEFSKTTRNVSGVDLRYNHQHNIDLNDWDGTADKYAPNFESQVKQCFSFAEGIESSKSASPGEKGYVYLSNSFVVYMDINKNNYNEMLKKIKLAFKKLAPIYV